MGSTFIDIWLVAEGTDSGRWFVIHTQQPRFVMEIGDADDGGYQSGDVMLIDECLDASMLASLAREAGEVFAEYDRQLPDEDEDY